jgi:hypothetical protein
LLLTLIFGPLGSGVSYTLAAGYDLVRIGTFLNGLICIAGGSNLSLRAV